MKSYVLSTVTALLVGSACASDTTVSTYSALASALGSASDGDTITLKGGTYTANETINVSAENVTLVSAGGKADTIIDGESQWRILNVSGKGFKVEGITFKNAYYAGNGGAISFSSSSVSQTAMVKDCDFIDCVAKYGGAIYAGQNSYSSFEPRENYGIISGCTFLRCGIDSGTSDNQGGGGAICGALWVEDSVFDACYCKTPNVQEYHLAIDVPSYMTVTNCIFRNHTNITRGLVGSKEQREQLGCARLIDCLIANNTSVGADDVLFHRKVILDRCVISNNSATATSTLSSLYRLDSTGDREFSKVTSCLFIDNKYPFNMANLPPLLNCTFVRNVGGLACDLVQSLELFVTNSVFWANVAKTVWPYNATYKGVPGIYWHPTTPLQDLIKIGTTVVEGGADNADVAAVLAADATGESSRLTALAAQKGPGFKDAAAGDWSLKRSSVLVDVGVKADWMDSACDIVGNKRCLKKGLVKDGAMPDIGCFEFFSIAGFKVSLR